MYRTSRLRSSICLLLATLAAGCGADQQSSQDMAWIEEIRGEDALAWVLDQNQVTFDRLKSHPAYEGIVEQVSGIPTPLARLLPYQVFGGFAYQLVENEEHPRGLWQRTTFRSLEAGAPV